MSQEISSVVDYLEKEKGIDRPTVIAAIKDALVAASKKRFGADAQVRIEIEERENRVRALLRMKVVDHVSNPATEIQTVKARQKKPTAQVGDYVEVEVPPNEFGRIAAQAFRQTMNQILRGVEKNKILDEFSDRVGTIVSGTVRRFDRSNVLIDLGKFEAVMPAAERVPTEEYNQGDRIRALVLAVENHPRGPEIILSRSHPNFVRSLFELEVSELKDNTIEIKAMAREAGYRTKIAVWSRDEKVDPVSACVGMRGARVKNIVRELNNEKIDLFKWSNNLRELVIESLKPARPKHLEFHEDTKRVTVLVDAENFPLAIGKRGQNARLTAKLTGWEIDIKQEEIPVSDFDEKVRLAAAHLAEVLKIDPLVADKLVRAGQSSIDLIHETSLEDLSESLPDVDPEMVKQIKDATSAIVQSAQT
ncbi:MAG: transcription termination factor NusA [Verrucomicrobiia bacterium]